jgi:hypothetical protein
MDRRPAIAEQLRQAYTAYGPRHLNVCKNGPDVWVALKHYQGIIRVRCLCNGISSVLDNVDGSHSDQSFVFDDQHARGIHNVIWAVPPIIRFGALALTALQRLAIGYGYDNIATKRLPRRLQTRFIIQT